MTSRFLRGIKGTRAVLGISAVLNVSSLPKFRYSLSVKVPETSVINTQSTLSKIPGGVQITDIVVIFLLGDSPASQFYRISENSVPFP